MAPPCRTLTKARRSDEFGVARILRSDAYPEGWGDPEAEEANKIVDRMVQMILRLVARKRTFSVENPWLSFIWQLKVMLRLFRLPEVELVLLHQCPYGALTPKATGILTNASWMKRVCAFELHYQLNGHGLVISEGQICVEDFISCRVSVWVDNCMDKGIVGMASVRAAEHPHACREAGSQA